MTRARPVALALAALAIAFSSALAWAPARAWAQQTHWPPEAEKRFHEALQLSLKGQHLEAAEAYRQVADWPEGGDWKERARALHASATELQTAHELEKALATYRELVQRFPRSDFVAVAERAANALEPAGVKGGLDYQRRWSEALDVLLPARTRHDRGDVDGARPGLEKAEVLLAALLEQHDDHPRIVDVAVALSETLARLRRYDEADAVAEKAVALAERAAKATGLSDGARADLARARQQRLDVRREVRIRLVAGRGAIALLVVLFVSLGFTRPWKRATRRLARLGAALVLADVLVALGAIAGAEHVRHTDDPDSLLTDPMAAVLVLGPGLVGIALALGFTISFPSRKGVLLAAAASVLGALATSTILIHQFGFDRLLPEF